jgi:transposase InsO family protein
MDRRFCLHLDSGGRSGQRFCRLSRWNACAGWLYVAAAVGLFSRRVVGWSMSATMAAQLVTDAPVTAIWSRDKPDALLHHSDRGSLQQ